MRAPLMSIGAAATCEEALRIDRESFSLCFAWSRVWSGGDDVHEERRGDIDVRATRVAEKHDPHHIAFDANFFSLSPHTL